ncbi:putative glycoside hydrolase [Candidatus Gracilibacteria bacterium]|nr:putative glycoside hydrolase [Candidatus Gracilibacteria bacterium]
MFLNFLCHIFLYFGMDNFCEPKNIVTPKIEEAVIEDIHLQTPEDGVRSLYYTASGVIDSKKYNNFLDIAENTSVNSITIDIKTVSGEINFDINNKYFKDIQPVSNNRIKNIEKIIEELHSKNIYVIGRVVVFKDMSLSEKRKDLALKWNNNKEKLWTDHSGKKYLDPSSKEVWDYNISIASAAYEAGFDEINFDYVRFPSDGKVSQIYAPFSEKILVATGSIRNITALNNFSKYTATQLKKKYPEIVLSADVFGLVTNGDLDSIGQSLIGFLKYFDYVGPMTYPSHYGNNFLGFKQPDNHPYEIMQDALKNTGIQIEKYNAQNPDKKQLSQDQIRLWLQGFSCTRCRGATPYFTQKFKKQTSGITDVGGNSWWVWNANSNYYKDWYE